jgi:hypothetical protein
MIARITARRPMRYRGGADASIDRPAHVRSASALVWLGARLVVVQDDAAFLAIVDPLTGDADDVPFGGPVRVFEERRGNKRDKPDLEAAFALGDTLVAIGSGGPLPARQVIVTWTPGTAPVVHARPRLFDVLARACAPAGGALNVEGACVVGDELWIAHRGGDRGAPDVLARWPRGVLDTDDAPPPPRVETIALGAIDGVALHLTDLAVIDDRVWFAAAAEATDSYYDDGEILGAAIGVLGGASTAILDERGAPARDKIEGLAPLRDGAILACVDADDPDRPADLLEIELSADGSRR